MNLTNISLRYPYLVAGLVLLTIGMGFYGFYNTPVDLFPTSDPPQVTVVTVQPGASAGDVADRITEVLEKELNTIGGVESIRSTSRDEVSSITVEFSYTRSIENALVDVQNSIARIQSTLPDQAREPRVFRLNEYTSRPLLTLSLRPKEETQQTLRGIRLLAENDIKTDLLQLDGVADVDVFGGHEPAIRVRLDRDQLAAYELSLNQVIATLSQRNISAPVGRIFAGEQEYLLRVNDEFTDLESIRSLPVKRSGQGEVKIRDLGSVELSEMEPRSAYHGNGKQAIALGLIRPDDGRTVETIERIKNHLPELKAKYQNIEFAITQDQQPLIDLNMRGMTSSVIQAIVLTVIVIMIFLGDTRSALVVSLSIPLSFLFTLIVIWLSPFTLNMITLTGIIVAIGMVVDGAVVALENIYRHYNERDCSALEAAREGTAEIRLAIIAGMFTTIVVLIPLMFMGGYPQRTIGRLSFTIATTLFISLIVSLSVIPLLASRLLDEDRTPPRFIRWISNAVESGISRLETIYIYILKRTLKYRLTTLGILTILLGLTIYLVLPLIGAELMPPMDTGISSVKFSLPSTTSIDQTETVLSEVEEIIQNTEGVERISSVVGSEPGAISFGTGGSTAQVARLTIYLVDRTEREQSIWDIQSRWRQQIREIPDMQSVEITEFGATPVSSTRAPLDVMISGPDPKLLDQYADRVMMAMEGVDGLVDVQRTWYRDSLDQEITVNSSLARYYGTSSAQVADELRAAVDGIRASSMRLQGFLDIPIQLEYASEQFSTPESVKHTYINTRFGPIPLRTLAKQSTQRTAPIRTREDLRNTINITGVSHTYTIAQVNQQVKDQLSSIDLPSGYELNVGGTLETMRSTQMRLRNALLLGVILLFVLLFIMFQSFIAPFIIMSVIPFTIGGALWGLLLFDKPICMPGNMGMIFLAGVVVNNSVLLLDFIYKGLERGYNRRKAILESIRIRIRPILMTTASTVVGLSPLVLELAVGLERLSPLAVVASTGLLAGAFLTMIVIPVVYSLVDDLRIKLDEVNPFR